MPGGSGGAGCRVDLGVRRAAPLWDRGSGVLCFGSRGPCVGDRQLEIDNRKLPMADCSLPIVECRDEYLSPPGVGAW